MGLVFKKYKPGFFGFVFLPLKKLFLEQNNSNLASSNYIIGQNNLLVLENNIDLDNKITRYLVLRKYLDLFYIIS
jgi:hypothetical protein